MRPCASPPPPPAPRRRTRDVIEELGYRPNAHARALKEGRTRTIGLVIPPAGLRLTDMQVAFVGGIVDAAARADLDVLISSSGGDHDRSFERVITGGRVDGVVLMEVLMQDPRVDRLQRSTRGSCIRTSIRTTPSTRPPLITRSNARSLSP